MIEFEKLSEGTKHDVYMLRRPQRESPLALEYIEEQVEDATASRLVADIERIANMGPPRNRQKWEGLRGHAGLYEIKRDQARLFCFFHGKRLVITHGFTKRQNRTPKGQIERAERLREEYHAAVAKRGRAE